LDQRKKVVGGAGTLSIKPKYLKALDGTKFNDYDTYSDVKGYRVQIKSETTGKLSKIPQDDAIFEDEASL